MTAGTVGLTTVGLTKAGTRDRLLATALHLFGEHGVEGTSLQMIADALGVTKAAVYYHFKTKNEIAEAVAEPALQELYEVVGASEKHRRPGARVDAVLAGFVELIVRYRELVVLFSSDLGLLRVLDTQGRLDEIKVRLVALLAGPDATELDIVTAHVTLAGLGLAGGGRELMGVSDENLRAHLLELGRRMMGRPRRRA